MDNGDARAKSDEGAAGNQLVLKINVKRLTVVSSKVFSCPSDGSCRTVWM